ncbi:MAG: amidinotransferase [Microbacterium sp.]|jgi:hypothetical protein|uniref:citrulline utilization hydrolase CtlX n=1 Tax=Microbacterium sp. TaxID=51671 RepID=UPI002836C0EF|nr:arginine deiminase-related protein [Microbacterium sp.]MDR2323270.1 amidinotransferase [Microbacterium sp.]
MSHAPSAVILVRPSGFSPNAQTAADNAFQSTSDASAEEIARRAFDEVAALAEALRAEGVTVHLFDDQGADRPDSVFPNNWISTHAGGHVALFPMYASNRRGERRADIVEMLKSQYRVQDVIDYSGLEPDDVFLEGTGAMVLDHEARIAYVARSHRADPVALERFCTNFGFEPMAFDAVDDTGAPIYHTNVMMAVGTELALIALDMITDDRRRAEVSARLSARHEVIALTRAQIAEFAGNAIELQGASGRILVMSARARAALRADQVAAIERSARIVAVPVPTIELAGGSVRCMIAGIHLDPRPLVA